MLSIFNKYIVILVSSGTSGACGSPVCARDSRPRRYGTPPRWSTSPYSVASTVTLARTSSTPVGVSNTPPRTTLPSRSTSRNRAPWTTWAPERCRVSRNHLAPSCGSKQVFDTQPVRTASRPP